MRGDKKTLGGALVHFSLGHIPRVTGLEEMSACGEFKVAMAKGVSSVTCGKCKLSKRYKEAVKDVERALARGS